MIATRCNTHLHINLHLILKYYVFNILRNICRILHIFRRIQLKPLNFPTSFLPPAIFLLPTASDFTSEVPQAYFELFFKTLKHVPKSKPYLLLEAPDEVPAIDYSRGSSLNTTDYILPVIKLRNCAIMAKLFPTNPTQVMVIRNVTPDVVTMSLPFARFGRLKFGARGTLGMYPD